MKAHSWYSSRLYAYRWDADRYMVHIYCLSGSNGALLLQYHCHGRKIEFSYIGAQMRTEYQTEYRSMIIGELLFLSRFRLIGAG